MVQYDYLEHTEGSELVRQLNEMAKEGWRLVGFSPLRSLSGTMAVSYCAIVERESPDGGESD